MCADRATRIALLKQQQQQEYSLLRRRLVLSIVVCVFSMARMLIVPTNAWFTDAAYLDFYASFRMAGLSLAHVGAPTTTSYQFGDDDCATTLRVQESMDGFWKKHGGDQAVTLWLQWLEQEEIDLHSIMAAAPNANVGAGGIVMRRYEIHNSSRIPVFFRIERAELVGDAPYGLGALWSLGSGQSGSHGGSRGGGILIPSEGFFYSDRQIEPGDTIAVTFVVYVAEAGPGIDPFHRIAATKAEVIQATSNAVHLHDGWEVLASFLPMMTGDRQ